MGYQDTSTLYTNSSSRTKNNQIVSLVCSRIFLAHRFHHSPDNLFRNETLVMQTDVGVIALIHSLARTYLRKPNIQL